MFKDIMEEWKYLKELSGYSNEEIMGLLYYIVK